MNRVGKLIICIACGAALSVTARGDTAPIVPNPAMSRQNINTNLMNRIKWNRKHLPVFPGLSGQGASQPNMPQANTFQAKMAQPNTPQAKIPSVHIPKPSKFGAPVDMRAKLAASAVPAAPSDASAPSGNPYESIVTRNVFGLNPIPVDVPQPKPDGPPPPKITLTGIMTIFGPPEALFKVAGVVRERGQPHDESYIFTEGEMQDDVLVKTIDTNKMVVSFMNHGVQQDIGLTEGTASSGSAPSAPTWPGQPARRPFGRFFNRPGGNPGGFQSQGGFQPGANNNMSSGFNNSFGGSSYNNNANNGSSQPTLSPDDQAALIAAEHAQAIQQNNPTASLYPSTPYDKQAMDEASGPGGSGSPSPVTPVRPGYGR